MGTLLPSVLKFSSWISKPLWILHLLQLCVMICGAFSSFRKHASNWKSLTCETKMISLCQLHPTIDSSGDLTASSLGASVRTKVDVRLHIDISITTRLDHVCNNRVRLDMLHGQGPLPSTIPTHHYYRNSWLIGGFVTVNHPSSIMEFLRLRTSFIFLYNFAVSFPERDG